MSDNQSNDDSHAFPSFNTSNSLEDLNKKATTHISAQQHQKSKEKTEILYNEEKADGQTSSGYV